VTSSTIFAKDIPMSRIWLAVAFSIVFVMNAKMVHGQHCPPIVESYIESFAVKHIEDGISLNIAYKKRGGQLKESYQAYIVAYSHFDVEKLLAMSPQEAIDTQTSSKFVYYSRK